MKFSKRLSATLFLTLPLVSAAVAFEDIYEPDNELLVNFFNFDRSARGLYWKVKGLVIDKLSGNPIEGAIVVDNCNRQDYSDEQGEYHLNACSFPTGIYALTVIKPGYKTLSCHFPTRGLSLITRHLSLIPASESHEIQAITQSGEKLLTSQMLYRQGDQLKVGLPLFPLAEDDCVLYYFGIQYPEPDNRLFIIEGFNQLVEVKSNVMPHWNGIGYSIQGGQVVIDKSVEDIPLGEYKLYLLRMPGYVEDPFNHLHLGELNVTTFNVE